MSWDKYSQTPASNYVSPYFVVGMLPSLVKVAGSTIMADLAQFMSCPTSTGTANAQVITNTQQFGAMFRGMRQSFVPGNTNTGAVTIAVDGLAATNVFANGAAAIAGMLVSGVIAHIQYDGTNWVLINPQRSMGSFTGTLNVGATTTGTINYSILPDGQTALVVVRARIFTTSSAATLTITGVPAILVPTASTITRTQALLQNNGGLIIGWFDVSTSTWTGGFGTAVGGFANPGANGVLACVITIPLS